MDWETAEQELRQLQKMGVAVPALDRKPTLWPEAAMSWRAFRELRQSLPGERITWPQVAAYCEVCDVPIGQRRSLACRVLAIEREFWASGRT